MPPKPSLFELLDHCCSVCGGRLLLGDKGSVRLVRCAECGSEATAAPSSRTPWRALCWCGIRLAGGQDAGLRCRRAVRPTPEHPNEVVVHQESQQPQPSPGAGRRPVKIAGED